MFLGPSDDIVVRSIRFRVRQGKMASAKVMVVIITFLAARLDLINCRELLSTLPKKDSELLVANTPSVFSAGAGDIDYEPGYVVETILDGDKFNLSIFLTAPVTGQDYVYALDKTASQLLRLKVPIDPSDKEMYRIVVGDGSGTHGYRDGVGEKALLDQPRGLAVDDNGNIYVADVKNRVVRKITPTGYVSTIAGQRDITGHADGEGGDALFSADFDLTYLPSMCALCISDRGNRRLRKIQLQCGPEKAEARGGFYGMDLKGIFFGVTMTGSVMALWMVLSQTMQLRQCFTSFLAMGSVGAIEPLIEFDSDTASEVLEHPARIGPNSHQGSVSTSGDGDKQGSCRSDPPPMVVNYDTASETFEHVARIGHSGHQGSVPRTEKGVLARVGSLSSDGGQANVNYDTASEIFEHVARIGHSGHQGSVPPTEKGMLARVASISGEGGQANHGDTMIICVNAGSSTDDYRRDNPETSVNSLTCSSPGAASSSAAWNTPNRIDDFLQKTLEALGKK